MISTNRKDYQGPQACYALAITLGSSAASEHPFLSMADAIAPGFALSTGNVGDTVTNRVTADGSISYILNTNYAYANSTLLVIVTQWTYVPGASYCRFVVDGISGVRTSPPVDLPLSYLSNGHVLQIGNPTHPFGWDGDIHELQVIPYNSSSPLPTPSDTEMATLWKSMWIKWDALTVINWDTWKHPVSTSDSVDTGLVSATLFDTTTPLNGTPYGTCWLSAAYQGTVHRVVWDLEAVRLVKNMRIVNFHDFTYHITNGTRSLCIYVKANTYPTTVPNSNVTADELIFNGELPIFPYGGMETIPDVHPLLYFPLPLSRVRAGRYIVFDTLTAWSMPAGWGRIGMRRVEIESVLV
jgi:hypothetical protein